VLHYVNISGFNNILGGSLGIMTRQRSGIKMEKPYPIYQTSFNKQISGLNMKKKRSSKRLIQETRIEEQKFPRKVAKNSTKNKEISKETRWKKEDDRR